MTLTRVQTGVRKRQDGHGEEIHADCSSLWEDAVLLVHFASLLNHRKEPDQVDLSVALMYPFPMQQAELFSTSIHPSTPPDPSLPSATQKTPCLKTALVFPTSQL